MNAKYHEERVNAYIMPDCIFHIMVMMLVVCAGMFNPLHGFAGEPSSNPATSAKATSEKSSMLGGTISGGSGAMTPDLFTGTMAYSIPIEVPAGRKGMQPNLALTYTSNSSNGWVGVGWDLDVGAIERSARNGINYNGDEYILRMNGSAIDLIKIGGVESLEYRAKIESSFLRVVKTPKADGSPLYWEVYDKSGMLYTYGKTAHCTGAPTPTRTSQTDHTMFNKLHSIEKYLVFCINICYFSFAPAGREKL